MSLYVINAERSTSVPCSISCLRSVCRVSPSAQMMLYTYVGLNLESADDRYQDLDIRELRDRGHVLIDGDLVRGYLSFCCRFHVLFFVKGTSLARLNPVHRLNPMHALLCRPMFQGVHGLASNVCLKRLFQRMSQMYDSTYVSKGTWACKRRMFQKCVSNVCFKHMFYKYS